MLEKTAYEVERRKWCQEIGGTEGEETASV